ncbi:hypothetical protein CHUAL_012158 [Chamberlinius hualienensis]
MDTTNSHQIRSIYSIDLTRNGMTDDTETTGGFSQTSNSITNEPGIVLQNPTYVAIPIANPKIQYKNCCSRGQ